MLKPKRKETNKNGSISYIRSIAASYLKNNKNNK